MSLFPSVTVEPPLHFSRPLGEKLFFVLWNGFYSAIFPVMDGVIAAVSGSAGDKNMTPGEMVHITGSFDFSLCATIGDVSLKKKKVRVQLYPGE